MPWARSLSPNHWCVCEGHVLSVLGHQGNPDLSPCWSLGATGLLRVGDTVGQGDSGTEVATGTGGWELGSMDVSPHPPIGAKKAAIPGQALVPTGLMTWVCHCCLFPLPLKRSKKCLPPGRVYVILPNTITHAKTVAQHSSRRFGSVTSVSPDIKWV